MKVVQTVRGKVFILIASCSPKNLKIYDNTNY